jgi:hypothetical protein
MLSPLDDLPIHQVAEPIRRVGTSDRNFYDRYYFNCHPSSDELFLILGMGQYPNLGTADAFALVVHDGVHRVVRASKELGVDRLDTTVGPFHIEVIEGLKRLRCTLEPNDHGLSYDLTWEGVVPAHEEPRHVDRSLTGRVFLDACRLAQLGGWSGWLDVDGTRFEVTPDRWWGSRDRSWGIRPVGEPEPPGIAVKGGGEFRWLYAPVRVGDHALFLLCQERGDGSRVVEAAERLWPDGRVEHLGRPELDITWAEGGPGLQGQIERAVITAGDVVAEITPVLPVHLGVGTGYGFDPDGWKHGAYQGELAVQGRTWDLRTDEGRSAMWGIVDAVAHVRCGDEEGWGLLEWLWI